MHAVVLQCEVHSLRLRDILSLGMLDWRESWRHFQVSRFRKVVLHMCAIETSSQNHSVLTAPLANNGIEEHWRGKIARMNRSFLMLGASAHTLPRLTI